jgi:hypothetical protein
MPFLFQVGATALCGHGGQVTAISSNTRVFASGAPVATAADTFTVAGCPFTVPPPVPCVSVQWVVPATRVLIGSVPAILQSSQGICVPNGVPPTVVLTQVRVQGQ